MSTFDRILIGIFALALIGCGSTTTTGPKESPGDVFGDRGGSGGSEPGWVVLMAVVREGEFAAEERALSTRIV